MASEGGCGEGKLCEIEMRCPISVIVRVTMLPVQLPVQKGESKNHMRSLAVGIEGYLCLPVLGEVE